MVGVLGVTEFSEPEFYTQNKVLDAELKSEVKLHITGQFRLRFREKKHNKTLKCSLMYDANTWGHSFCKCLAKQVV